LSDCQKGQKDLLFEKLSDKQKSPGFTRYPDFLYFLKINSQRVYLHSSRQVKREINETRPQTPNINLTILTRIGFVAIKLIAKRLKPKASQP